MQGLPDMPHESYWRSALMKPLDHIVFSVPAEPSPHLITKTATPSNSSSTSRPIYEVFERFVQTYEHLILNYLWRMTGDEQSAFDLTQETFLRAWQKFAALKDYDLPKAWLLRVATNLASDTPNPLEGDELLGASRRSVTTLRRGQQRWWLRPLALPDNCGATGLPLPQARIQADYDVPVLPTESGCSSRSRTLAGPGRRYVPGAPLTHIPSRADLLRERNGSEPGTCLASTTISIPMIPQPCLLRQDGRDGLRAVGAFIPLP